MSINRLAALAVATLFAACSTATKTSAPATPAAAAATTPAAAGNTRVVNSRDGSFQGEIVGTPAPGSKFAKLQIGMDMNEIQAILGHAPERSHTYESGKRWIPFYFGNDARRMQALYKGEGCLIVTGGNAWGGGGGDLIQINVDPTGACYTE